MIDPNSADVLLDGLFKRLARTMARDRETMGELYWIRYRWFLVQDITKLISEKGVRAWKHPQN